MTPSTVEAPEVDDPPARAGEARFSARPAQGHSEQEVKKVGPVPVWVGLVLITGLGGVLRFVSLDRPALWGDEAFTYSRVCGGFRHLLDILQFDGFMPLHYVIYWALAQVAELTPFMMRLPVAVAGMLMPPAMYLLARQAGLAARAALLAALFTACSAYMLTYSRDAKMYAPFWTAIAAHVGCLLWWLNHRPVRSTPAGDPMPVSAVVETPQVRWWRRAAVASVTVPADWATSAQAFRYLCWLGTGVLMVGFHAMGLAIVALQLLIVLTHRRLHWRPLIGFVLGVGVIGGLVGLHFTRFTQWDERVKEEWNTSGVGWVQAYNRERDGVDLVAFTFSSFLMSWEVPPSRWQPQVDPRALKALTGATILFATAAVVGLFPWRRWRGLFRWRSDGRMDAPPFPWRTTLWLSVWLVLPAYLFYCRSIQPFAAPWTLLADAGRALAASGWWVGAVSAVAVSAVLACAADWRGRLIRVGQLLFVAAVVFGLLSAAYGGMAWAWQQAKSAGDDWKSVWMPRYLGFVWPAFAIALSVLVLRLPTRPVRLGAIGLLLAINLVQFSVRVWGGSEPRTDLLARDVAAAQPLAVRGQQLALDHLRVTQAMLFGQRPRLAKLVTQVELQPLVAPETRVFVQTGFPSPAPGGGVMGSLPSRYYLCQLIGIDALPRELRRLRGAIDRQWFFTVGVAPKLIAADARNRPAVRRIITWDRISPGLSDVNRKDPVPAALGPAWRRVDEQIYPARDHWTWSNLYQLRRREYVRIRDTPPEPPATRPATLPATRPATRAARVQ